MLLNPRGTAKVEKKQQANPGQEEPQACGRLMK
jgi:hypothetical protein